MAAVVLGAVVAVETAAALVAAVVDPVEEAQVEAGKSPIVAAIAAAERGTTGEIRVHLSKRRWDPDPFARAQKIFAQLGMYRTNQRNAVLLYVNLRKRKFAIIGDEGIHQAVGGRYWQELSNALRDDLHSTHLENALALAVRTIGLTLARFFPAALEASNPDELTNEITED